MKKSKILVPALAVLAFSTAASITGTVAWFTASRTATFNAGAYTVAAATSGLDYSLTAGVGTQLVGTTAVSPKANYKLSDASFDHSAELVYEPASDGKSLAKNSGTNPATYGLALASVTESNVKRATNVYSVFTWDITFTYHFKSVAGDYGLFVNPTFTNDGSTTGKGFRMAFVTSDANAVDRVIADLQTASNCKYIESSALATAVSGSTLDTYFQTGTAYVAPALIDSAATTTIPEDETYSASTAANQATYLGKFVYAEETNVSLAYKVVCWYEGTDPNVVTLESPLETIFDTVTVDLEFKAVKLSA